MMHVYVNFREKTGNIRQSDTFQKTIYDILEFHSIKIGYINYQV